MTFRTTILAVMAVGVTWAQAADDEPGRGVARLSLIQGNDVSVRRGDSGDVVAAAVNAPVVVQDEVIIGLGSRAELQFDWANMLRLSANTAVRLGELEYQRYIVQLAKGTITWRVLRDQDAYVEISTPTVSVRPVRTGTYRVTVGEDGSSEITVRAGEAELFSPRGSERLTAGVTMLFRGTPAEPQFRSVNEMPVDDWDRWNADRDRTLLSSQSYKYVSPDVYGAEDLDTYGSWLYTPTYSWVWNPRVDSGWAPYRLGRWTWMDWYGWSWVSSDPWGWAPYHYGRWFHDARHGWCWYPGSPAGRQFWAPAHVAFFGFNGTPGVDSGLGWGHLGWVPLAPHEPLHKWWGTRWYQGWRNQDYVNSGSTIVNNVNFGNLYRNSRVSNGVTIIDNENFRRGHAGFPGRFGADEWRQASLAQGPIPVAPGRDSLRVADRESLVAVAGTSRGPERFFSNHRPAVVDRIPFEDQRRVMETIARRTFDGSLPAISSSTPAQPAPNRGSRHAGEAPRGSDAPRNAFTADSSGAAALPSERGSRHVGEAPRGGVSDSAAPAEGWIRFGSNTVREGGGRFGQPEGVHMNDASPAENWNRFGGGIRGTRGGSNNLEHTSPPNSAGRFGNPSTGRGGSPENHVPPMATLPNGSGGRGNTGSTRFDAGSRAPSPSGESIRISPPIMRERSGGNGGSGFDHSGTSRPVGGGSAPAHISPGGGHAAGGGAGHSGGGGRSR